VKTIHKYQFELVYEPTIDMPAGADVLSFQNQDGAMTIWALVDTKREVIQYRFRIIGTGGPIDDEDVTMSNYVGTAQFGRYVWHLFVVGP